MHDINLVLGTMTFGEQIFDADVANMIRRFLDYGYEEIDTAYVYNDGLCEKLLGASLAGLDRTKIKIASKVNPRITGRLDEEAVLFQVNESLKRLMVDYLDIVYLHFPDINTPIGAALKGCERLRQEGKIKELGLSNFPAWLVAEVYHICKYNSWILPTVYEGLYNPLSRKAEIELDGALNYYGMRYYAYNPLAGGVLTNKYISHNWKLQEGRFINRPNYQKRYWKESYFRAVELLKEVCGQFEISVSEATYRWLGFHSMLKKQRGDAIIVGASGLSQLEENLGTIKKGALPREVVDGFEKAWGICKADAPEYFRFYMNGSA